MRSTAFRELRLTLVELARGRLKAIEHSFHSLSILICAN